MVVTAWLVVFVDVAVVVGGVVGAVVVGGVDCVVGSVC